MEHCNSGSSVRDAGKQNAVIQWHQGTLSVGNEIKPDTHMVLDSRLLLLEMLAECRLSHSNGVIKLDLQLVSNISAIAGYRTLFLRLLGCHNIQRSPIVGVKIRL